MFHASFDKNILFSIEMKHIQRVAIFYIKPFHLFIASMFRVPTARRKERFQV